MPGPHFLNMQFPLLSSNVSQLKIPWLAEFPLGSILVILGLVDVVDV